MINNHLKRLLLITLLFCSPWVVAAIDTASLVKVTPENNPNCVEYYRYKNEMYCSTTAQINDPVDPAFKDHEKQQIVLDDRPWHLAWGNQTSTITTIEYVPAGTDINNWHELVTTQFIPGLQQSVSPWAYAHNAIDAMKKNGFNPTINFIENKPDYVIFEFQIKEPANLAQHEIQMITKGSDGLYILHYAIKNADMDKANREKWIDNIRRSTIIKR